MDSLRRDCGIEDVFCHDVSNDKISVYLYEKEGSDKDRLPGSMKECLRSRRLQLALSRCRHELGRMVCCVLTPKYVP